MLEFDGYSVPVKCRNGLRYRRRRGFLICRLAKLGFSHSAPDLSRRPVFEPTHGTGERRPRLKSHSVGNFANGKIGIDQKAARLINLLALLELRDRATGMVPEQSGCVSPRDSEVVSNFV
jgi:hypothetical protein